jgi:hypothetical protein
MRWPARQRCSGGWAQPTYPASKRENDRPCRFAATLNGSPAERAKVVRSLIEKVIVKAKTLTIKVRRSVLLGRDVPSSASEDRSDGAIELTAAVVFKRRGVESKVVLPGVAPENDRSRLDPMLIKMVAGGRAWFEELGLARSRPLRYSQWFLAWHPSCGYSATTARESAGSA